MQEIVEAKGCNTCRFEDVCIDPCENCKMLGACECEQGDPKCQKIVGPGCERYELRYPGTFDLAVERFKKVLQ
jgi:hypothetical protein